jgi:hypothetical protein
VVPRNDGELRMLGVCPDANHGVIVRAAEPGLFSVILGEVGVTNELPSTSGSVCDFLASASMS